MGFCCHGVWYVWNTIYQTCTLGHRPAIQALEHSSRPTLSGLNSWSCPSSHVWLYTYELLVLCIANGLLRQTFCKCPCLRHPWHIANCHWLGKCQVWSFLPRLKDGWLAVVYTSRLLLLSWRWKLQPNAVDCKWPVYAGSTLLGPVSQQKLWQCPTLSTNQPLHLLWPAASAVRWRSPAQMYLWWHKKLSPSGSQKFLSCCNARNRHIKWSRSTSFMISKFPYSRKSVQPGYCSWQLLAQQLSWFGVNHVSKTCSVPKLSEAWARDDSKDV